MVMLFLYLIGAVLAYLVCRFYLDDGYEDRSNDTLICCAVGLFSWVGVIVMIGIIIADKENDNNI